MPLLATAAASCGRRSALACRLLSFNTITMTTLLWLLHSIPDERPAMACANLQHVHGMPTHPGSQARPAQTPHCSVVITILLRRAALLRPTTSGLCPAAALLQRQDGTAPLRGFHAPPGWRPASARSVALHAHLRIRGSLVLLPCATQHMLCAHLRPRAVEQGGTTVATPRVNPKLCTAGLLWSVTGDALRPLRRGGAVPALAGRL